MLVQVIKEPINDKGARITSYISTPGRYLVMMPFSDNAGGISRKIENPEDRRRLRDLLRGLTGGDGGSFIIRTAGLQEDEKAIIEDHDFLAKQWRTIKRRISAPTRRPWFITSRTSCSALSAIPFATISTRF
jgi:Rne/Rng family ribonuclease